MKTGYSSLNGENMCMSADEAAFLHPGIVTIVTLLFFFMYKN